VTKNFNIVQDSPATATYSGFTSTQTTIGGNIACADLDGINSCEYALTANTP